MDSIIAFEGGRIFFHASSDRWYFKFKLPFRGLNGNGSSSVNKSESKGCPLHLAEQKSLPHRTNGIVTGSTTSGSRPASRSVASSKKLPGKPGEYLYAIRRPLTIMPMPRVEQSFVAEVHAGGPRTRLERVDQCQGFKIKP